MASRLSTTFANLKQRNENAFIPFVTGGDPSLAALPDVLNMLADAGADVIEVGLPFSDPIADGPTIQASSQRALDAGVTPRQVLQALHGFDRVPVIVMGYYNTMLRLGLTEFVKLAQDAGVAGAIVSDLIPEEAGDWIEVCRKHDFDTVFLAAPTSTDARLDAVANAASGFVYAVSRTGVTGAETTAPPEVSELVQRVQQRTTLPVCVGFGISKPEHVRAVCEVADGAVVGSWLVDRLHRDWNNGEGRDSIQAEVAALKQATR